jgi:hypothetical protein
MEGPRGVLAQRALDLLVAARAEAEDGYREGDPLKVRRAAERAWKAACAATDAAMEARGIPRDGTTADRARHYAFLDTLVDRELPMLYALVSDRLHQLCAHDGHVPIRDSMELHLDEVDAFIRRVTTRT